MPEGTCVGGPLDGLTYTTRSDAGLLAVDKPAGLAWLYRAGENATFVLCTADDESLSDPVTGARVFDEDRAWDGAMDSSLDIVAIDAEEL